MHALAFLAPVDLVELVSDALMFELDAKSVSVEDADASTDDEQALFGEPGMPAPDAGWRRSRLTALFESAAAAQAAVATLKTQPFATLLGPSTIEAVPDADWVRLTQSQFEPIAITETFWVVPTWHAAPAAARTTLRLDPGQAFGSGTHPTTRMCLRWIADHARTHVTGQRVLDYGCGSGILGIAAAMHGASRVDAVDIDPVSVEASRQNANANAVTMNTGLPDEARGHYALVVANILATPLKVLAPLLTALVAPGGSLVMAGVLSRQFDEMHVAYLAGFDLQMVDEQEGWILLTGTRRQPD